MKITAQSDLIAASSSDPSRLGAARGSRQSEGGRDEKVVQPSGVTKPDSKRPGLFLTFLFLAMLAGPPLIQSAVEVRNGAWPRSLRVFHERPTPENLRSYEKSLEDSSVTVRTLRPWMQVAQLVALREAGSKGLVGRDSWLFYQPGVNFLTQRRQLRDSTPLEAIAAVKRFRDDLAARGIRLVVMPAPNKESVYPDRLTSFAKVPTRVIGEETRTFLEQCRDAGIEMVDLFALYRNARRSSTESLYLSQDSHWSPLGVALASAAVSKHILERGWVGRGSLNYQSRSESVQRLGDIVRMSRSPQIERQVTPETVTCSRVIRLDTGDPYADDPASEVLVLGDSFLRIYQQDEPGQAGFVAHLAHALGRPLASVINDGGGATLVRQELYRRPELLNHAKVVVWEFVERDLRLATEGWQIIPLPPNGSRLQTAKRTD